MIAAIAIAVAALGVTVAVAVIAAITVVAAILAAIMGEFGTIVIVHVVAVEIVAFVAFELIVLAAARLIFFKARTRFGQHAEIMIGELQIIFGVDAIPLHLRIAGERFVFFQQLRGIATGAVVDPVAIILAATRVATLRALPATTATAAVLTIVNQVLLSLCLKSKPALLRGNWMRAPRRFRPDIARRKRLPRPPAFSGFMTKDPGKRLRSIRWVDGICPASPQ
jgi:hypothetical protein